MQNLPIYVLKQKKLNKSKTVNIFRRNYLNIDNFKKTEYGWCFEENFNHYGNDCYFKISIKNNDILAIFKINEKSAKIRGKHNCFGVFLRTDKKNPPFEIIKKYCDVELILKCNGKKLAYDNGKGIRKTIQEKNKKIQCGRVAPANRRHANIPNSVSWSICHPYRGGSCSGK